MNNSQVAHVWAQQRKESANGSSFYFEGPTIYSFGNHYPIATFTGAKDANGEQIVFFANENGWGGYTGRHRNHTIHALHGLPVRVFSVCHVLGMRHSDNVAAYLARFESCLLSAARARTSGPFYMEQAEAILNECADYCAAFGQDLPPIMREGISPALLSQVKEKARVASIAKREKTARDNEARAERERAAAIIRAGEISAWRVGRSNHCPYNYGDTVYLRLSSDGASVETSRGALVPVADAARLWRMVAACQKHCQAITTPPPVAVGEFSLRGIDHMGDATIGCHYIKFAESQAFAAAQGWTA